MYRRIETAPSQFFAGPTFNAWEFPILAKYRFKAPVARPFIDAGPSFRYLSGLIGNTWSHAGFTVGAGVDVGLLHFLHIQPEFRYTRWGSDSATNVTLTPVSKQNQVEFLVGLSF